MLATLNLIKKQHDSAEFAIFRLQDSVAKRHRTECETMLNRRQAPVAARSLRENTPPVIARGARHIKQSLFHKDQMIYDSTVMPPEMQRHRLKTKCVLSVSFRDGVVRKNTKKPYCSRILPSSIWRILSNTSRARVSWVTTNTDV